MKRLFTYIMLLMTIIVFNACFPCSEDERNERTVIMYMDANNNLSPYAYTNLNDILENASTENMKYGRLLVFLNTGQNKRLYEVKPFRSDKGANRGDTTLLATFSFNNALTKEAMREVISKATKTAPADETVLILWSHSTGWMPSDISIKESGFIRGATERSAIEAERSAIEAGMPITKTFGMDGKNQISYEDLATALDGLGIDMVAIDACFGTCVEALYDLRHCCDYVLGSPIEILGEGYPYADLMNLFFDKDTDIETLGRQMGAAYMRYYRNYTYKGVPYPYGAISLIDMSEMEDLASVTRSLIQKYPDNSVVHSQIQSLENRYYSIFFDFEHYMRSLIPEDEKLMQDFTTQLSQTVLFHDHTESLYSNLNGYSTRLLEHSCGLSSYIPRPGFSEYFDRCDEAYFQTNWSKMIYNR